MQLDPRIRRVKIHGYRHTRKITCPYCKQVVSVTIVPHLRSAHPTEWKAWTDEFFRIYNKTNDLKRVMRAFTNSEGQLILSWTVIDRELRRKIERDGAKPEFVEKSSALRWGPRSGEYTKFSTTVWDVPHRGAWGVHQPTYRGNWAPQIARALLEHYSQPGDRVLDPFVGGGTTLLEAWVLGRHAVGLDISKFALELTRARLAELEKKTTRESMFGLPDVRIEVRKDDARVLDGIEKESIDFICTHPPYGDVLRYTDDDPADLSQISEPDKFIYQLAAAGRRFLEVLKPNRYCALLIGDLRRLGKLYTLGFDTLNEFRAIGFTADEIIIKTQHQDRSTEFYFRDSPLRLRLGHEYLLIFRKPGGELQAPGN